VRLSPDERRGQLIAVGVGMLTEHALEDISVDDIARRAGISRGLLVHYFASKHDFHEAVARHIGAEFLIAIAPDRALEPVDRLRDAVERYIGYVEDHRAAYLAILVGRNPGIVTFVDELRGAIATLVQTGVPVPPDHRDHPRLTLAIRGWTAFAEATILTWTREKTVPRFELADLLVDSLPALARSAARRSFRLEVQPWG
jgi:AcrR family transcriptional regulator